MRQHPKSHPILVYKIFQKKNFPVWKIFGKNNREEYWRTMIFSPSKKSITIRITCHARYISFEVFLFYRKVYEGFTAEARNFFFK